MGATAGRRAIRHGRIAWGLLVLAWVGACGRSSLLDTVYIHAGSDAATGLDGGRSDGSAVDGAARDATHDSRALDASHDARSDATHDATDARDGDDAGRDAGTDGCPLPLTAISGRAFWASGAQGDVAVYASARGPAGSTAIVGVYGGPVTLGPFALSSAMDEDSEYVPQAFVAELDSEGNYVFATAFVNVDGPTGYYYNYNQAAFDVAFDGDGNLVVVGGFQGEIRFPGSPPGVLATNFPHVQGSSDYGPGFAYVVKLDPHGQHLWSKSFGSLAGGAAAYAIVLEPDGHIVLGGSIEAQINFAGADAGDGGPLAFQLPSTGGRAFVLSLTSTGEPVWARILYSFTYSDLRGMVVDTAGNIYVAGSFADALSYIGDGLDAGNLASCDAAYGCNQTAYAVKIVPDGGLAWHAGVPGLPNLPLTFGGSAFDDITVDGLGNASVIGWFYDGVVDLDAGTSNYTAQNVVVVSFDEAGGTRWTVATGHSGPGQDGIACDALGDLFVSAQTRGNITFPDGYDAGGPSDAATSFIARLHPDGTTVWGHAFPASQVGPLTPMVDKCATSLIFAGTLGADGVTLESVHDGGELAVTDSGIVVMRIAP